MAKLEWEKARKRDKRKRLTGDQRAKRVKAAHNRQEALRKFVAHHDIGCFKCGTKTSEWGKTGLSKRGAWAICLPCVKSGKQESGRTANAA